MGHEQRKQKQRAIRGDVQCVLEMEGGLEWREPADSG